MFFSHLKLCASLVPVNHMTYSCPVPVFQGKQSVTVFTTVGSLTNHLSASSTLFSLCAGQQRPRVLLAIVCPEKGKVECSAVQPKEYSVDGDTQKDRDCRLSTDSSSLDETEIRRRRNIGLANKGKVPWNKGRKHSEETRERIRQRTREALSDPKVKSSLPSRLQLHYLYNVRKKMSECPRSHSHLTKARIKVSLRKLWGKRLKRKRSMEKVFQLWADSIANAAKDGGNGQVELEWDSYDKQKKEMALQQQALSAKKAKEKELACIRAEVFAMERSERKEQLANKKKQEQEKRGKAEIESRKKRKRKSKEEKEEVSVTQELKLKARLTKIHNKKSVISQVSSDHEKAWRKLDLKLMDIEQSPREMVTLADQIRLAKVKRLQHAAS